MIDLLLNAPKEEQQKQLVLIKYPGIVKNVDSALKSLGGLQRITSNHYTMQALELNHTPDNPYASCIMSERKNQDSVSSGTLHLVMKIRRKKRQPTEIKSEIIGMVNSVYTFNSMADFQYLPIKRRAGTDAFEDLMPNLIPTDTSTALNWWGNSGGVCPTSLFLPPYQFSRYTHPSVKLLARETDYGVEKTRKTGKSGFGQNLRVERKALSITVNGNEEFPIEAQHEAIDCANLKCKHDEPHRLLKELFEERPMWTRVAILFRTGLDDSLLKFLLPKYAFYIQSGPWGRLWCRFGYDPRNDRDSAKYQTLMVSIRQNCKIPEKQRLKVTSERLFNGQKLHVPINFVYEKGHLPRVRQMWYSIVDVHLPEARDLLDSVPIDCDPPADFSKCGWITPESVEHIRRIIKNDVAQTSHDEDAIDEEGITVDEDF